MLVLTRKVGETILIGDNIAVTVVQVGQSTVRLGVEAPQQVAIVRQEIKGRARAQSGDEQHRQQSESV
jgi:carbon storage regulator